MRTSSIFSGQILDGMNRIDRMVQATYIMFILSIDSINAIISLIIYPKKVISTPRC